MAMLVSAYLAFFCHSPAHMSSSRNSEYSSERASIASWCGFRLRWPWPESAWSLSAEEDFLLDVGVGLGWE